MNKVIIMGRLTADPTLRSAPSGTAWTSFTLAVERRGTNETKTDFIPCVAFKGTAEFITNWFYKGRLILIEGSIQSNIYKNNGKTRTTYSVSVEKAEFTGEKSQQTNNSSYQRNTLIHNTSPTPSDGFVDIGSEDDGSDLPF